MLGRSPGLLGQSWRGGGGCACANRDCFFHWYFLLMANVLYVAIFLNGDYSSVKEVSAVNAVLIM